MDGSDPARIEQGDWPTQISVTDKCMLGFPTSKAHYQVDVHWKVSPIQITVGRPYKSLPLSHTNHCHSPIQLTATLPYKSLPLSRTNHGRTERIVPA